MEPWQVIGMTIGVFAVGLLLGVLFVTRLWRILSIRDPEAGSSHKETFLEILYQHKDGERCWHKVDLRREKIE